MTTVFDSPAEAMEWSAQLRRVGQTVGFVPTMGALHVGHLELVRRSVAENDASCVSVFVNPLQFDSADDFERYPRDVVNDAELLASVECDVLFTGTLPQFFPELGGDATRTDLIESASPGARAFGLEGEQRSGHFEGVATIVKRLFDLVQPTRAYFGEKDYQQTLVVEDLARDLGYPEVVVVPTFREPSGLAYSSRNALLSMSDRETATSLSRGLFGAREAWSQGERNAERLLELIRSELAGAALELEYLELRDPDQWEGGALSGEATRARALIAARVGEVRLIDNLRLDEPGPANLQGDR